MFVLRKLVMKESSKGEEREEGRLMSFPCCLLLSLPSAFIYNTASCGPRHLLLPFPGRGCRTNILDKHVMSGAAAARAEEGGGADRSAGERGGRGAPERPHEAHLTFLQKTSLLGQTTRTPYGAYGLARM